jgi:general stress protein 26
MADEAEGSLERVRQLIASIAVAMATTASEGDLVSRPLLALQIEGDADVYFLTRAGSDHVRQVRADPRVNLAFVGAKGEYLSVAGRGTIGTDAAVVAALWNPTYRAWFPGGAQDPELVVLRVVIERADYWEGPTSRLVRLYGVAHAVLTGQPYESAVKQSVDAHGDDQRKGR